MLNKYYEQEKENNEYIDEMAAGNTKKQGKKIKKIILFFLIFLVTGIMVFSNQVLITDQSNSSWFARLPIIKQIRHLAESADRSLKGEKEDRINILLLAMGGSQHEGGYLTDTIMLTSIEPSTNKVSMISIPRDFTVPIEGMGWRKINNINAFAEMDAKGSGGLAVSQAVSDILNIPIDYYIRVDFEAFINIINHIGGIDVEVENTFDDYSYPVKGMESAENYESRYEHLHFDQGWQSMDGETALKFARSRHAAGIEGSDFARAKRQQKIMEAVKEKILGMHILFKPSMISDIINEFHEHITTNLKIWELVKLWDMARDIDKNNIINKVLDNSPSGLLYDSISEQGAYILTPRSGDFAEIQYFVNNIFSEAPTDLKAEVANERATVEVRNGTWINGLASQSALDLEKLGFIVLRIGNSRQQNFEKSVIFDLTYGEKMKSLTILKNRTGANISFGLPQWLVDEISNDLEAEKNPVQPDFILILGQNADITNSGETNPENQPEKP